MNPEAFPKNQAEIEKQRTANQKRWEDVAIGENKKRPILEKLTGKNKIDAEVIMRQEALVDDVLFDTQLESEFSQEEYLKMGKILSLIRDENFRGLGELYKNLNEGKDVIRNKILNKLNEYIKNRKGKELSSLYKEVSNNDPANENEKNELESLDNILKKLELLTSLGDNYAVRFVNIGEYENIINTKAYEGEVTIIKNLYRPYGVKPPAGFIDYLDSIKDNFAHEAGGITDYENNARDLKMAKIFPYFYKVVCKVANARSGDKIVNINCVLSQALTNQQEFIENNEALFKDIFPEDLIYKYWNLADIAYENNKIGHYDFIKLSQEYFSNTNDIQNNPPKELERLIKMYGRGNLLLAGKFFIEPESFDKEKRREFITVFLQNFAGNGGTQYSVGGFFENRQYHLMLVYNLDAVGDHLNGGKGNYGENHWGKINTSKNSGINLLGVVSCMNDKNIVKKIIEISKNKQDFASPIFDANGNLRLPSIEQLMKYVS